MSTIKQNITLNIKNIPGPRINRKMVIMECDDWGGIRMPSIEVYDILLKRGYEVDKSRYSKFDTLADKYDLEKLFEVLVSVKDSSGHPAVMVPVVNTANPDFEKIQASGFAEYHNELFTKTLEKYGRHPDTFSTCLKGMEEGIFVPEFHGREHISVQLWMNALQQRDAKVLEAFEHGFVAVDSENVNPHTSQFRPELFFEEPGQLPFLKQAIAKGAEMFEQLFDRKPNSFVPGNSIFHPALEESVIKAGIKYLHVAHFNPIPDGKGNLKLKYYRNGKKTSGGLRYYVRNCAFEPTDSGYRGIDLTLRQMEAAFRWNKPAIISTHRVNFVGGIDIANRDQGLLELRKLLKAIIKRWPDVEFMSSQDMFQILFDN